MQNNLYELSPASISFMMCCDDQEKIDYYCEKFSSVLEAEQCEWLKKKYGVSWPIVSSSMDKLMRRGKKERIARLTKEFLKMKKFDLCCTAKGV
jgi:predicted 3-demethylubiquinone-9 3-methyltransferase (glyoxalase superfamily)